MLATSNDWCQYRRCSENVNIETKVKVTTVLVILTLSGNEIQGKQYIGTHANSE